MGWDGMGWDGMMGWWDIMMDEESQFSSLRSWSLWFVPYGARTLYVRVFLARTTSHCIRSKIKLMLHFSIPYSSSSLSRHKFRTTFLKLKSFSHKQQHAPTVVLKKATSLPTSLPFPSLNEHPRKSEVWLKSKIGSLNVDTIFLLRARSVLRSYCELVLTLHSSSYIRSNIIIENTQIIIESMITCWLFHTHILVIN